MLNVSTFYNMKLISKNKIFLYEVRICLILPIFFLELDVKSSISCPVLFQGHTGNHCSWQMRGNGLLEEDNGGADSDEINVWDDFQGRLYWLVASCPLTFFNQR